MLAAKNVTDSNRQAPIITREICIQRRKVNYALDVPEKKTSSSIYENKTKEAVVEMSIASSQNIGFSLSSQASGM